MHRLCTGSARAAAAMDGLAAASCGCRRQAARATLGTLTGVPAVRYELIDAGGDRASVRSTLPDGRSVMLHSTRDPRAEGARLAATVPATATVLVAGLGLGWHVAALQAQQPQAHLYVVEPDAELLALARQHGPALAADRLALVTGSEEEILARLQQLTPVLLGGALLLHNPSLQLWRTRLPRLTGLLAAQQVQRQTAARLDTVMPENLRHNRAGAVRDPDYTVLRDVLAGGVPALVAAGPSLDRARALLHACRDRLRLVAVDTALAALVDDGLEPDLTVAIDPFPANARHFTAIGTRGLLAYAPTVHHAIPPLFPARRRAAFAAASHLRAYPELAAWWGARPVIDGGSTVAVVALELIQRLAPPGPLLLIGSDFGFPGGSVYARGTRFQREAAQQAGRFATVETANLHAIRRHEVITGTDLAGGTVLTHANYFSFRQECEARLARAPHFRYIQLAGGGLAMQGTEPMTDAQLRALLL